MIGSTDMIPRPQGIQRLRYTTKPALSAILTPEQERDQLRIAIAALEERHDAMVEALKSDLAHAEEAVEVSRKNLDEALNTATYSHRNAIYKHNEGYRDAIKRVVELVERVAS